METVSECTAKASWNKGKIVGQKAPLKLKDIWAIRVRLQLNHRTRELALFDLGLDSKLRACDLVKLRVKDICHGDRVSVLRQFHCDFSLAAGQSSDSIFPALT
jgi:hypothetical protein